MLRNKVGFEAEVFLKDSKGELVIPSEYGLPTDDYLLLAEIRAKPGNTKEDAYLNFMLEFEKFSIELKQKRKKLSIAWEHNSIATIPVEIHNKILRKMGNKEISSADNIYPDTDILSVTDSLIDTDIKSKTCGQIIKVRKSCGFHIHFSSNENDEITTFNYKPVEIGTNIGGINVAKTLYIKGNELKRSLNVSRITMPVIREFVTRLDNELFSKYNSVETKFRRKGFFEEKPHGFEYRSLPFTPEILNDLFDISKFSFKLFDLL
jgi:hypothetical protein